MGSRSTKSRLLLIVAGLVSALLIPATSLPLENYKPRDLIEARYGDGQTEFGKKNYDGELLGALFFTVGADGDIYVYDGIKGNVKVYGSNGEFARTIKAVAWDAGILMPWDMTLTPDGDLYVLCETSNPHHKYRIFLTAAGADTVTPMQVAIPSDFLSVSEYPVYDAARIMSDRNGNIYLANRMTWRSVRLIGRGRTLVDSAHVPTLRDGVLTAAGSFLSYREPNDETDTDRRLVLLDEKANLVKDLSLLDGFPLGTDSLGNLYLESLGGTGKARFERITKYSPEGRVLAVIDLPRSLRLAETFGKGDWIVAADGSIYEMIAGVGSVRVRRWERVK